MSDVRIPSGLVPQQGLGEDPLFELVRILVTFFQNIFGEFEKGSYRWSADELSTDLVIQGEATVSKEVVERRPAIVVQRGGFSGMNLAMDQLAGPLLDPNTGKVVPTIDPQMDSKRRSDLMVGAMQVNCISKEGLEAQRLAWLCVKLVRAFKKPLLRAGFHRIGEEWSVGAETPPGALVQPDSQEATMVVVSLPCAAQQTWTVSPLDKTLLTRVSTALRSEVGALLPSARIRPPGYRGQTFDSSERVRLDQDFVSTTSGGKVK